MAGVQIDGVNNKIDFDDDQDTSISANTDDTLVFEVAGATDFTMTANTFTAASGSTIAAQALTATTGAFTDSVTITTADNTNQLTLVSTDADGGAGPKMTLQRDSASPADGDVAGRIHFVADDDGGNTFEAALIDVTLNDVSNGSEDATLDIKGIVAGSEVKKVSFGAETVFNEDSADIDFRVESNGNANMLFVSGGNDVVGIGAEGDLGVGLHIKSADSGASVNANADELVVEGNDNSGLSILSGTSGAGNIYFGDSGDNDIGIFRYDHGVNAFLFNTNANSNFGLSVRSDNKITTNAETSPDCGVGGLTLNQGAFDDQILSFKSSDIAHGMTAHKQTDTFAAFEKHNATEGGVRLVGLSESGSPGVVLEGFITSATNTEAVGSEAAVMVNTALRNSTSIQDFGADDNLFAVRMNSDTRFIVKGDGELFSDQTATVGTYDAYEDAQLVRAYDLNHMQGVINSKFDKFVQYNADDLQKAKLIGTDDQGNATSMVNVTGMQRLHNGAIWQQYEKHQRLAEAVYEMAKETLGKDKADAILEKHDIKLLN